MAKKPACDAMKRYVDWRDIGSVMVLSRPPGRRALEPYANLLLPHRAAPDLDSQGCSPVLKEDPIDESAFMHGRPSVSNALRRVQGSF